MRQISNKKHIKKNQLLNKTDDIFYKITIFTILKTAL